MPSDLLFGRLVGLTVDIPALIDYYHEIVEPTPSTRYHDHSVAYDGWSIMSRDGTTVDGVKRIEPDTPDRRAGNVATPLLRGAIVEILNRIMLLGLKPQRVRVMRLAHEGYEMKWHRDGNVETWRLHVPILTNDYSFFDWQLDGGTQRRVYLAAGSAWLVRVDELHRAVNVNPAGGSRVHLLMSLGGGTPPRSLFDFPILTKD